MIKNTTPYLGKIRLKFEKFPHYSGKDILNKIHLDLGFTKLVSRITPDRDANGPIVNPKCIDLIKKNTGLKVETHTFGPNNEYTLHNSCINPDGKYVGSIEEGWWYYNSGLRATKGSHPHTAWSKEAKQWIGYSHRSACAFGKGDKLFDADWVPSDNDLHALEKYYVKHLGEFQKDYSEWLQSESENKEEDFNLNKWAVDHIPFKLRGAKTIHSYEDAYKAAVNFAKYIG
jgi:hypothetical protein